MSDPTFTDEQLTAIERRSGDLLLDAGAGSGKTSVLVERFAQMVLHDGVDVGAILTITFTEKAAAELRERIRARLRALGAVDEARATEGAFISTIHGFCARVLRAQALAAGVDPAFAVLDRPTAARLMDVAFDGALAAVPGVRELLAGHGVGPVRAAVLGTYAELRSRGETSPALPALPRLAVGLDGTRSELLAAAAIAAAELGTLTDPGARVVQALDRLARLPDVVAGAPWPGDLDRLKLPGGNGAALSTDACCAYSEALAAFKRTCEWEWSVGTVEALGGLVRAFGDRYVALKRSESALDFEDLELMTRDLLTSDAALRARYRERFAQIMVDEQQDTNAVQLSLIESIADGNLFTVGDAQQSIYGFRHADVALFERRGAALAAVGSRLTLRVNFRSRPEILRSLNLAFETVLGERCRTLEVGRTDVEAAPEPRVELLIADKGSDWEDEGIAAPWRVAEARALAARVAELVQGGVAPREVVLLSRATTDLRAYERALEERGVPTYVIGGRGYWAHPQVIDIVCYLRALANPRDEEALYTVLTSPLVGVSLDALVIVGAAARSAGVDPFSLLAGSPPEALTADDRSRVEAFVAWFGAEREAMARCGLDELIERALRASGYDLAMLAMPGGVRRLANVRKLMRLAREHEAVAGADLRGFVELVQAGGGDPRESEAPVEGEALDAVRLMTIHRAKGLEFPVVCVADLGRVPFRSAPVLRLGRDGRVGVRLARPGTGAKEYALDYLALRDEQFAAEGEEERRLYYVAMTRACERLVVSGAVNVERWLGGAPAAEPMAWVAPALAGELGEAVGAGHAVVQRDGVAVAVTVVRAGDVDDLGPAIRGVSHPGHAPAPPPPSPAPPLEPAPPVASLSYSSLADYARCGYRFYLERVLRLPPGEREPTAPAGGGLSALERGVIVHALLERVDFRRPLVPGPEAIAAAAAAAEIALPTGAEAADIGALLEAFVGSDLCRRLAAAGGVRREERFTFLLDGLFVGGVFDVLAWEPGEHALVVDYKSDRLEGRDPVAIVSREYETQRLIYALAALRGGAAVVEVAHVFLERAGEPVVARFGAGDAAAIEARLRELAAGVMRRDFTPAPNPHRALCSGCPGEGGLCTWPLALTRREAPDRLF
ncbi:MAG TPA: UvrD-helicase domain-containing protein [Solirubrobacteraceae bacterium]|nr:UvrD-helicase domain-containing protein [Solirubrobacteraceae bacterium]